jgi:DNA-binding beta-propeller fold protein YncE
VRPDMAKYRGQVAAPEFPEKRDWLNTDRPLTLEALRGKVVLLDFWTYCCINCMHVLPDLKRLEYKYAGELVVVGVHSAKFSTEGQTENIRQAILRYDIGHPVINDHNMILWRAYGIQAWPSFVLIDPDGKVIGYASGEGIYDQFDPVIAEVVKAFDAEGKIDRRTLKLTLERDRAPRSALSFPGKVLADEASKRLFIADSNHDRIVVVSPDDHSVLDVIGTGEIGFNDGAFDQATFSHPQGMALDGSTLYVADTENHAIRRADFDTRTVSTIAGTGTQARTYGAGGPGHETALNSPWDLVVHDGALYIAMAGPHQIWRLDLTSNRVAPYAGSGREARIDGPLASAALAQPSGITTDGTKLYVADSEVSSIRSADLDPKGQVRTIVGGDLFEFGDRDGTGLRVRLQHPLGVVYYDGVLYVADTYNNKIKRVSLADRSSKTFLGTGKAGHADGDEATFDEPGGVSIAGGKLYVADTNNHAIRVADLATRRVETFEIKDAGMLWPKAETPEVEVTQLAGQTVAPGEVTLHFTLSMPEGYKLNAEAPSFVTVRSSDATILRIIAPDEGTFEMPAFPIDVPVNASLGQASIRISYALYYCQEGKESLCYFDGGELALPVTVDARPKERDLLVPLEIGGP